MATPTPVTMGLSSVAALQPRPSVRGGADIRQQLSPILEMSYDSSSERLTNSHRSAVGSVSSMDVTTANPQPTLSQTAPATASEYDHAAREAAAALPGFTECAGSCIQLQQGVNVTLAGFQLTITAVRDTRAYACVKQAGSADCADGETVCVERLPLGAAESEFCALHRAQAALASRGSAAQRTVCRPIALFCYTVQYIAIVKFIYHCCFFSSVIVTVNAFCCCCRRC